MTKLKKRFIIILKKYIHRSIMAVEDATDNIFIRRR